MIYDDLNKVEVTHIEILLLRNTMASTTVLSKALRDCDTVSEVIKMLYVELIGDFRSSAVARIVGRYRVLTKTEDWEGILKWRDEWENKKAK